MERLGRTLFIVGLVGGLVACSSAPSVSQSAPTESLPPAPEPPPSASLAPPTETPPSAPTEYSFDGTGPASHVFAIPAGPYVMTTSLDFGADCDWKAYLDGFRDDPLVKVDPSGGKGTSTSETTTTLEAGAYTLRVEFEGDCGAWAFTIVPGTAS